MRQEAGTTPVLVGVGAITQREPDPARALEPMELLARAFEQAADDAGSRALLGSADRVMVPRGMWPYADPAGWLAEHLGARGARTLVSEIGVLQTTLLSRAAREIAEGKARVVLVGGAEARYRVAQATRLGVEATHLEAPGEPDEVLRPHGLILSRAEIELGLARPVTGYALLENALRAAEGQSLADHRREVAEGWAAMSHVAAGNPDAWRREPVEAALVGEESGDNPMFAFPYTRRHCSSWNVDQAAALILCSLATARSLGIPEDRMVHPLGVADCDEMRLVPERRELHRSPGFEAVFEGLLAHAACGADEIEHLELYSCFPVAVRIQRRALGIAEERPATLTGGMAFAGGPLNSFVLQSLVTMARVLRRSPGSRGLLTAVSGILTKQGASLWSTEPSVPFAALDASQAAAHAEGERLPFAASEVGSGRVVSYTVQYESGEPSRAVLLCEGRDGTRNLSVVADRTLAARATREELCGTWIGAD